MSTGHSIGTSGKVPNIWLHRFALFVVTWTLFLLVAGASVTSTGSGLAVPDWPLSFGQFFPAMEGGVFYEHGHRMIAGVALVLTVILAIWLHRREERPWVRKLGVAALIIVLAQAVLGGMTVLLKLPAVTSVSHAGLAQAFLCMVVAIAVFTSPGWWGGPQSIESGRAGPIRWLAAVTTGAIYVQILLGAVMRHTGAGLAIPDFPLTYGRLVPPVWSAPIGIHYAHRVGAGVVSVLVVWLAVRILGSSVADARMKRPALVLAGVLAFQVFLGALTIWMRRAVVPTTAHVAFGAVLLAVSLVVTLRAFRFAGGGATVRREATNNHRGVLRNAEA